VSERSKRNEIFSAAQQSHPNVPMEDVMKDDFSWQVPVESVPIPSQGKIYPEDSPLYRKETIEIKAMTASEEDILASRALIQKGEVLNYLIKSCVINKSINPQDLLSGDRNALMIAIRVTGYGTDYHASANCKACDARNTQIFNLGNLEIKRLKVEPVTLGVNLFEYTLPVTKKKVGFKLLTGHDQHEIDTISERKRKMFPDDVVGTNVTSKLLYSIQSVDGISDKNKIRKFIQNMPALDSRKLRKYMEDIEPGIDMATWMTCTECGEETKVSLPVTTEFFWPRE